MKIDVSEHQHMLRLTEVFEPILLVTEEENTVVLCMRDDTIELTVAGSDRWYRADMETGEITEM